jgi:hypothetical protein
MNEAHWLAAIERYDNDEEIRRGRNVEYASSPTTNLEIAKINLI